MIEDFVFASWSKKGRQNTPSQTVLRLIIYIRLPTQMGTFSATSIQNPHRSLNRSIFVVVKPLIAITHSFPVLIFGTAASEELVNLFVLGLPVCIRDA